MSHFQLCTIHEIVIVALLERQKKNEILEKFLRTP